MLCPVTAKKKGEMNLCSIPGCGGIVAAKNLCMRHYKRLRRGQGLDTRTVGEPDGFGTYGVMARDEHAALCHECGGWFASVGAHLGPAHAMTAVEYRRRHGLMRTQPLTSRSLSRELAKSSRNNIGGPGWARFESARDPQAAADARTKESFTSPASRAARAVSASDGRMELHRPMQIRVCPVCGTQFTHRSNTVCSPHCLKSLKSQKAQARHLAREISEAEAALLSQASGDGLAELVRRLQKAGRSSASIGRALGKSPTWMSQHFPRPQGSGPTA